MVSASNSKWKVLALGVPLLILIFVSMAASAFLAVHLIIGGVRESAISSLLVGTLLAVLWLFMAFKTAKARRPHG